MFQVIVPSFFVFWWNLKNEVNFFLHAFFTGILYKICMQKNACKKALVPSFFKFHRNKKHLEQLLETFPANLVAYFFLGYWKFQKKYTGFFINCDFSQNTFFLSSNHASHNVLIFGASFGLAYVAALAIWIWPKSGSSWLWVIGKAKPVLFNCHWKIGFSSQRISEYRNRTTTSIPFLQAIKHFCNFIPSYWVERFAFYSNYTSYYCPVPKKKRSGSFSYKNTYYEAIFDHQPKRRKDLC